MLRCLLLSRSLKSFSLLSRAIQASIKIALPTEFADVIVDMVTNHDVPLPSAGTLSRFQLSVDAGYMLWHRRMNQYAKSHGKLPARYFTVASSEQCGADWLISSCAVVLEDDLVPLSQAIDTLVELRAQQRRRQGTDDCDATQAE
eukprot:9485761-Pyramimonas_sp.AAC.1